MFKRSIPILLAFCAVGILTASASASVAGPGWTIDSVAAPTNFSASENTTCPYPTEYGVAPYCDRYEVSAMNAGSEPTTGAPVTLTDVLPENVTVQSVKFYLTENENTVHGYGKVGGAIEGEPCENETTTPVVQCTLLEAVPAGYWLRMG